MKLEYYQLKISLFLIHHAWLVSSLRWEIGKWSDCTLNKTCAELGHKSRNVSCFDAGRQVAFTLCSLEPFLPAAPKLFKYCITEHCLKTHKDNLKVYRTEWSTCTKSHNKNNIHQIVNKHPTKCGKNDILQVYTKTRQTQCRFYNKKSDYFTIDKEKCEKYLNITISTVTETQMCYTKCVQECALTLWTKWKTCTYCREVLKYKMRSVATLNARDAQCGKKVRIKAKHKHDLDKRKNQIKVTGWRQVGVLYQNKKIRTKFSVHKRNVSCITREGDECEKPADEDVTSHQLQISDRDCFLSGWSLWSFCNPKTELQARYRDIIVYPLRNGKPCDIRYEERSCKMVLFDQSWQFEWMSGKWSVCTRSFVNHFDFDDCVVYKQRRSVMCVSTDNFYRKPVNHMFCPSFSKPVSEKICDIQCPLSQCIYDLWKDWEECENGFTKRKRGLVSGDIKYCVLLSQKKKCDSKAPFWVKNKSKTCEIFDQTSKCGEGVLNHFVTCQLKNTVIDDKLCDPSTRPLETENCLVACMQVPKCTFSSWSLWTPCLFGKMQRKRTLLVGSIEECPGVRLSENKECSAEEYFWHLHTWGECKVDKNSNSTKEGCFIGTQKRNHVCVKDHIGHFVDDSKCFERFQYNESSHVRPCTMCTKPCVLSPWSDWYPDCSATCVPFENSIFSETHRHRYVISQGNNDTCPGKLIETRKCPICLAYHWIAQKWDICVHNNAPTHMHNSGLMEMWNGYQIRNVYCSDGSRIVPDSFCQESKPIEYRDCHIDWFMSCNLRPWSEWSECDRYCNGGTQIRRRAQLPKECNEQVDPSIEYNQTRLCNTHPCLDFNIQEGEWSECQLVGPSISCADLSVFRVNIGVRFRNVTCLSHDGKVAPLKYCEELYEEKFEIKQSCVKRCSTDCELGQWSAFTPCSKTCGVGVSMRHNRIRQQASSDRPPCPTHNAMYVVEKVPCKVDDCFDFEWQKGEWSPCKLGSDTRKCGKGIKKRSVFCTKNSTGQLSDRCLKENKPKMERNCKVPCDGDCIVSDWSKWSDCVDERTTRRREILEDGEDCPSLEQVKRCPKTKSYKWIGSGWGDCIMNKGICGMGLKKQIIECIDKETKRNVPQTYCSSLPKPPSFEVCERSCHGDCELSTWTTWTNCNAACGKLTYQSRTRIGQGKCRGFHLRELIACPVMPCYTLTTGEWSPCQPMLELSCGTGTRKRRGSCLRADGNVVDLNHCIDFLTGKEKLVEECHIPCWNDCIVSEWSQWSSCFKSCSFPPTNKDKNDGVQLRSRAIIQEPLKGGVHCPKDLYEERECNDGKCYDFDWLIDKKGDQKCVRSDGTTVSSGCKPLKNMFKCDCPVENAVCIQKEHCMCNQGYRPVMNIYGRLSYCDNTAPQAAERGKNGGISLTGIVCISLAACVGYCVLFIVLFLFYRRRKKQLAERTSGDSTPLQTINNNKDDNTTGTVERTRSLIKNNRNSTTCCILTNASWENAPLRHSSEDENV